MIAALSSNTPQSYQPFYDQLAVGWCVPRKFTTYERDGNASDDAMHRRYNRWHSRFDQPDPTDASYDLTDPQSLNRYSYVQNDPVNFVDPTGLEPDFASLYAVFGSRVADLPGFGTNWGSFGDLAMIMYEERLDNYRSGGGFRTNEEISQPPNPTLPNEITDFYKNRQGTIDRCINRIFGQHSDGTPDVAASVMPRQTLRNAPELDTSLTQFQLQGYTQAEHTQGTYGFPGSAGNGTVYIASDLYGRLSTDEKVRTYFHELGNILSHRSTGGNARAFGNPNGIGRSPDKAKRDPDTGARLESCIFGSVPF